MKPIVVFGQGELAQLAYYYFTNDSPRKVAGFTVDDDYLSSETLFGKVVVPFSQVVNKFPPQEYDLFIAIGYKGLNRLRRDKFDQAMALGYDLASYVSTRSMTWPDLTIGKNCLIMEGNTVQPFASIGDNVIIWSGSLVSHHAVIEDDVFIASQVVISGGATIGARSFLGVNATIREHVKIGRDSLIGAAAVILKDTKEGSSYLVEGTPDSGIPARRLHALL